MNDTEKCIGCGEDVDTTGTFDESVATDYGYYHKECYDGMKAGD